MPLGKPRKFLIHELVAAWPPMASRSMIRVRSPSDAALTAAASPDGPPPMMVTSKRSSRAVSTSNASAIAAFDGFAIGGRSRTMTTGRSAVDIPSLRSSDAALRRGCVHEVVQQPVASQDVPELVRACRARVPDAADRLEPDSLEPRPVREERADRLVELLVRLDPGLEDEVVHRPERHRLEERSVARAIAPVDEETPPRDWVELPDPAEELDARDRLHPVDRQHQGDGTFRLLARPQGLQRLATRGGLEDVVVLPVALPQLLPEPGELLELVVDDEDRCPGHQWLTPAPVAPGR